MYIPNLLNFAEDLTQASTYRKHIRIALIFVQLTSLMLLLMIRPPSVDITYASFSIIASIIYLIFYALFLAKYLTNRLRVGLGIISIYVFILLQLYITGGNASIFIGLLFLFSLSVSITLGFVALLLFAFGNQIILTAFLVIPGNISYELQLANYAQNTFFNVLLAINAFLIMNEYGRKTQKITEVETSAREQERINKEKDDLIAIVSHEFRTPLTAVKGYINLLKDPNLNPQDQALFIKYVAANISKLESIVEKTVNVSVMEAGVLSMFKQPVDIEKLVNTVVEDTMHIKAEMKNLPLSIELPQTRIPFVSCDPQYIRQVVENLLDDAIKYTDNGEIHVKVDRDEQSAIIIISDTGRGISAGDLPHLFQKFYRGGDYKTRTIEGSGLGLYLCKNIIEKHAGSIALKSELGKGTTFTVKLPLSKEDETWVS